MKRLLEADATMALGSGLSPAAGRRRIPDLWELPYFQAPAQTAMRRSNSRKTVAQGKRDARKRRNRLRHKAGA